MSDSTGFNSKRRLCPDGACVGVIGPNGKCTECGRVTDVPAQEAGSNKDNDLGDDIDDGTAFSPETDAAAPAPFTTAGGFDPNRPLCPDGACVGVIGVDGKCTECGRVSG
jgi:hypothetical protein